MLSIPCSFCDYNSFAHQVVTATENFYVIHSRRPLSRGHLIILPKEDISDNIVLKDETGEEFISLINKAIGMTTKAFNTAGTNVFANFGKEAGQEIPHTHFHIVPRYTIENVSPFQKLNDPELRKQLEKISPEKMQNEITTLQKYL